jgi:hypothetical protein
MHPRHKFLKELHSLLKNERLLYLRNNKGIAPEGNWILDYQIQETERALDEWTDVFSKGRDIFKGEEDGNDTDTICFTA